MLHFALSVRFPRFSPYLSVSKMIAALHQTKCPHFSWFRSFSAEYASCIIFLYSSSIFTRLSLGQYSTVVFYFIFRSMVSTLCHTGSHNPQLADESGSPCVVNLVSAGISLVQESSERSLATANFTHPNAMHSWLLRSNVISSDRLSIFILLSFLKPVSSFSTTNPKYGISQAQCTPNPAGSSGRLPATMSHSAR